MELRIPKERVEDLEQLVQLSPEQRDSFLLALAEAPLSLRLSDYASPVSARVGVPVEKARAIIRILSDLITVFTSSEQALDSFIQDLFQSMDRTGSKVLALPQSDRESFGAFVGRSLSKDTSFGMSAKARHLQHEYEHLFQDARVLSDLRPVYGVDASERPTAAVLTHSLRISYRDATTFEELFVSLQPRHLRKLREAIDRAEKKEAALRAIAAESRLTVLDQEDD